MADRITRKRNKEQKSDAKVYQQLEAIAVKIAKLADTSVALDLADALRLNDICIEINARAKKYNHGK